MKKCDSTTDILCDVKCLYNVKLPIIIYHFLYIEVYCTGLFTLAVLLHFWGFLFTVFIFPYFKLVHSGSQTEYAHTNIYKCMRLTEHHRNN